MPVVSCAKCTRSFNAPDNAIGKVARCPKCGNPIPIEAGVVLSDIQPSSAVRSDEVKAVSEAPTGVAAPTEDASLLSSPTLTFKLFSASVAVFFFAATLSGGFGLEALAYLPLLCVPPLALASVVTAFILFYRMWKRIPESQRATTPAKAVALLFVPFFGFYWIFRAVYGLSVITSKGGPTVGLVASNVAKKISLALCVLASFPFLTYLVGLDIPNDLNLEMISTFTLVALGGAWLYFQDQSVRSYAGLNPQKCSLKWLVTFLGAVLLITAFLTYSENLSRRRERAEIAVKVWASCSVYHEAQTLIYFRNDFDRDGVLEYAPNLMALYETRPGVADLKLLIPQIVQAEGDPSGSCRPYNGYCFKALQAQGQHAIGGAMSYMDANGNMTKGFAMVAYPASYVRTGRETFIVSHHGIVYKADLGRRTHQIVKNLEVFDPDPKVWSQEGPVLDK